MATGSKRMAFVSKKLIATLITPMRLLFARQNLFAPAGIPSPGHKLSIQTVERHLSFG